MNNLSLQHYSVTKEMRNRQNGYGSFVIWMTGLSGSGKSTLANELAHYFFEKKINAYVLDGDNMRLGLNGDLSFSVADRTENIRRVAEVAKLMMDAGLIVITAFISPFAQDRAMAKKIIGADHFTEVFIDCSLAICEERDVKGLYKKARQGEISSFTGIDSPFEKPENPDITITTDQMTITESISRIISSIGGKI